jgi:glucose/arabinose dehydrogenase
MHAWAKILLVLGTFLLLTSISHATIFDDPGFTEETVLTLPAFSIVGAAFAPDGRIFLWQRKGIIRIYKNGQLLPDPFIDISDHVNVGGDRGLLGIAIDPDLANTGYVYLLYLYEPFGDPNSPSARTARLTRVTADPNNPDVALPGSETTILGKEGIPPCSQYPEGADCISDDSNTHTIGTVQIAPDGKLYVGSGDGASPFGVDPFALRAQDLDSLNGKILRINPDGTAPIDNPFYDGTSSNQSKVFAYGLRNPFRFTLDPVISEPMIGDVGENAYEEIDRGRGANFGWPCFEGPYPHPGYQAAFQECQDLDPNSVTYPIYSYYHDVGTTVVGGVYYTATEYPVQYQGNFFFGDYSFNWIKRAVFDSNQNLISVEDFASEADAPVSFELGPDGWIYYVSITTGELRRIKFNGPFANASADPTSGYSPLDVAFSSDGSYDPGGQALTFFWDFGDGNNSNQPNPNHTYDSGTVQTFIAKLAVTNEDGESSSDTVSITVGSLPPTSVIDAPPNGTVVSPGDTVNFSGHGTDPDDGNLPASAMHWEVHLHHDEHVHTFLEFDGVSSGSFVAKDYGPGTYSYEIILMVIDSSGLTDSTSVNLPINSGNCLFCDDFEDGVLDPNWTYIKPTWTESSGTLQGNSARKAIAVATPIFNGCLNCSIQVSLKTQGGPRNRIWLLVWYVDKQNKVELLMKEENDVWVLKQRANGSVVTKAKAKATIDPNVAYAVVVSFDGTQFTVTIDGNQLITLTPVGTVPTGTVGFQVKATTGSFDYINVN